MKKLMPIACAVSLVAVLSACTGMPDRNPTPDNDLAAPGNLPGLENFAPVCDGVWRGAQPTEEGFRTLKAMGIKTIVNFRSAHDDTDLIKGLGFSYVSLPCVAISPDEDAIAGFLKIATDPACKPVFVHCQHGADRTGLAVAAYRMAVQDWPAEKAKRELPRFNFHGMLFGVGTFFEDFKKDVIMGKVAETKVQIATIK